MAGLLDAIFGHDTQTIDDLRQHTGDDPDRAEQAYGAAAGTILRGVEQKSQTKQGAENILDMIRKQIEKGNVKTDSDPNSGVQVRDMDENEVNDMMHGIFGDKAPNVQGAFGKVITMDPETSKKVFAKVLPAVLGQIFGATDRHPDDNPRALPKVVSGARQEMERQQPRSAGIFDAILDRDGDGDVDLNDLVGLLGRKPK
jgi:hypothetical protein